MAIPAIELLCQPLPVAPMRLCVTMPGGAKLCAVPNIPYPDLTALVTQALGQVSSALAPLQPIFDIIETVNAVFECIEALREVFSEFPPNPVPLLQCIPDLATKVTQLLKLLPQFSVPQLLKDVIGVFVTFFDALIGEIDSLIRLFDRIVAAGLLATSAPGLLEAIACGNGNINNGLNNISRLIGNFLIVIDLLNTLGKTIGLPEIPTVDCKLTGASLDFVRDALVTVRDAFVVVYNLIPAPGDNLGDLLANQNSTDC
jgi:hypothetical protein